MHVADVSGEVKHQWPSICTFCIILLRDGHTGWQNDTDGQVIIHPCTVCNTLVQTACRRGTLRLTFHFSFRLQQYVSISICSLMCQRLYLYVWSTVKYYSDSSKRMFSIWIQVGEFPPVRVSLSNTSSTCARRSPQGIKWFSFSRSGGRNRQQVRSLHPPIHQITRFVSKLCAEVGKTPTALFSPRWTRLLRNKLPSYFMRRGEIFCEIFWGFSSFYCDSSRFSPEWDSVKCHKCSEVTPKQRSHSGLLW